MIPSNIQSSHIIQAIELVNEQGYNSRREAKDYNLYFDRRIYPPKIIISYANIFANGTQWPASSFSGGTETNDFLIKRGFPILCNERKNPEGFFTNEELLFFDHCVNTPYDHNDPISRNAGDFIAQYIWERSKAWADRITHIKDFKRKGRVSWNEQRNNSTKQAFKAYSWYRLHHNVYHHEKVFYTVGVDGPPLHGFVHSRLLIKLDCYRSKMTIEEQEVFDDLLSTRNIKKQFIELNNKLQWEEIIILSKQYIDSTFDVYLEAIQVVRNRTPEMAARITWNSREWVKPSGRSGKSISRADTQEKRYGYTPEEWLFDFDKVLDDFHYARMEAVNADHHIGETYNLTLFAHESIEGQWFWIARIQNAYVIDSEISEQISRRYRSEKWLEEQNSQLDAFSDVGSTHYMQTRDSKRFNVRFRPEDVVLYNYEPFRDTDKIPSNHYNLPLLKKLPEFKALSNDDEKVTTIIYGSEMEDQPLKTITRNYTHHLTELENVHRKVQTGYAKYLREQISSGHKIFTESYKIRDKTRIDILELTNDGKHIFYEVKTYPNCRYSIRVAVGQLLEYAYFPDGCLTNEFVIVSHLPAGEIELKYLNHLSKKLGVIIRYVCYDHHNHQVIPNSY
ncbi:hypothetical protein [Taibaiella koreensis]|uniref:hypothetical protein n=1 Tax=Taibaiella koreensis TaxID=1268548 RepID=UPI000E5A037E|nr:hypothetical protein [Taibaiella koreensis]